MQGPYNAALLIDLENFFLGRERNHRGPYRHTEFREDLERLTSFIRAKDGGASEGERRFIVQRAYANFNVWRWVDATRQARQWYLEGIPEVLMEFGIEPIQVFRFHRGTNKNAVDMRLAMDATSLVSTKSPVTHFVLVTGDSDFIPVVVELRRHGPHVGVIGVRDATSELFARYSDAFDFFEDLLAAEEASDEVVGIAPIRRALATLLEQHASIRFAAVKPLLSGMLNAPFDPTRFQCANVGDFLRQYAEDLAIHIRRGAHDWEVSAHGEPTESGELAPAPTTWRASGVGPTAPPPDSGVSAVVGYYRSLLRAGALRIYLVPPVDWPALVALAHREALPADPQSSGVFHYRELQDRVLERARDAGIDTPDRKVPSLMFQLYASGCFVSADRDDPPELTAFHWDKPALLNPRYADLAALQRHVRRFIVSLLDQRGRAHNPDFALDVAALEAMLLPENPTPEERESLLALVDDVLAEHTRPDLPPPLPAPE